MNLIRNTPSAEIVTASKDLIDALIQKNTHNRKPRLAAIEVYRQAMEQGKWVLTNQGIGLSKSGFVIDGGHRLLAIREAGYPPVPLLLVFGLDDHSQEVVDTHQRRTICDRLKLSLGIAMSSRTSSVIRVMSIFRLKRLQRGDASKMKFSSWKMSGTQDLGDLSDTCMEFASALEWYSTLKLAFDLPAGAGAAICEYYHAHGERAEKFILRVTDNDALVPGSPEHTLHRYLMSPNRGYGADRQFNDYAKTLSCCKAHRDGRPLAKTYGSTDWESED